MISIPSDLKRLKQISPSRLTSLKKCPYKAVLSHSLKKPLLPYHPTSHLGNVVHKCIELIFAGLINDEATFENEWDKLIKEEENKLRELGFNFSIPIKENVSGYSIKKLQVKNLLKKKNRNQSENTNNDKKTFLEKWLKSCDQLIIGKVDLLYMAGNFSKIIDFKSGQILDNDGKIKEDYTEQLKLYAYLHNEEFNRYPDQISIVDLQNQEYSISYTPKECEELAQEAKEILSKINHLIEKNHRTKLAKPSNENCNRCLYKPACKYHWEINRDEPNQKFVDVKGKLVSIRSFRNGNINVTLKNSSEEIVVEGFENLMLDFFEENKSEEIAVYNVVKLDKPKRFRKIRTTKTYPTLT